jgi:transcriptional regulator with XRE-family HTH domain
MKIADLIKQELQNRGLTTITSAARSLGVSPELLRRIVNMDHIPRDRMLAKIARGLGMDPAGLILAAHRQQLPGELCVFTLTPAPPTGCVWQEKRKWPLSQEQCEYLAKVMQPHEIQLLRKYRQLSPEEKAQAIGYLNYMFATKRVFAPDAENGQRPREEELVGSASSAFPPP